jgi:Uma2 family endonuclease
MIAANEDITITRNGLEIAKLSAIRNDTGNPVIGMVNEKAKEYRYGGRKASYEEFLELTENTEDRYEYIDGEIYLLSSPRTSHQVALTELFGIFYNWFRGQKCTPFVAPYDITLKRNPENINVVQPDIMVICDLEEKLNEKDYYMGTPTLVVEILSEGTRRMDLIKKLDLYMSCGVEEYWIANPLNREVTIYLFKNNDISRSITFRKTDMIESFVFPGLTAEPDRIFR